MSSSGAPDTTSYDPISLTLSLFGFGAGAPAAAQGVRPGLMDQLDVTEMPLFVKSNSAVDRQQFIAGLRVFNHTIKQVGFKQVVNFVSIYHL